MLKTDHVLDAKGLQCPMPIVKTKKKIAELNPGEVLEVLATDKGSKADIKAWAENSGHQYIGTIEEDGVLKHYLRKASREETKEEIKYETVIDNETLKEKLAAKEEMTIIDVREKAEYAFGHIPNAISIPFGELEARIAELKKEDDIYVVCRTGNRSDLACRTLQNAGFQKVTNVVPGMSSWDGEIEKNY